MLKLVGAAQVVVMSVIKGSFFLRLVPMDPDESLLRLSKNVKLVGGHMLVLPSLMHLVRKMGAKTSV